MIILVSDDIEPWLKYIWTQFVRVNGLKTDYKLCTYENYEKTGPPERSSILIEYASEQKYPDSLLIIKKNAFKTDKYIWIRDDLVVFSDTLIEKNGVRNYDIFYNAFIHLSRLEEWQSEMKGRFIRSYSFKHPRNDKRVWSIPIVNHLFNELEKKIITICPTVSFGEHEKPIIEFSHDVDYISKTVQLRIKQTAYHFYTSVKSLFNFESQKSISQFLKGINFGSKHSDYWCFDLWDELEKQLKIKSVYYIYAGVPTRNLLDTRRWLLDPSYDVKRDKRLQEKCCELLSDGHEIGLHGSFYSAEDEKLFLNEKEALEEVVNTGINKTRQHWLNYIEIATPYILDKAGINYDSSIGFNDTTGFRSGIASIYNPYDHRNQRAFSFYEIPLVLMDAHIDNHVKCDDDFDWLFKCFDTVKNFAVSVDWHQRGASPEYGWFDSYKKLCRKYKTISMN
jgi:hypothetical protein